MRNCSFAALALLLVGCGGATTGVRVETQIVKVPVAFACLDVSKLPAKPAPATLTGDAQRDIALVAIQAVRWREVALDVLAMASGC